MSDKHKYNTDGHDYDKGFNQTHFDTFPDYPRPNETLAEDESGGQDDE